MYWIDLAEDRNTWRAVVKAIMLTPASTKCGGFLD
jgi:hypothetical protein